MDMLVEIKAEGENVNLQKACLVKLSLVIVRVATLMRMAGFNYQQYYRLFKARTASMTYSGTANSCIGLGQIASLLSNQ